MLSHLDDQRPSIDERERERDITTSWRAKKTFREPVKIGIETCNWDVTYLNVMSIS